MATQTFSHASPLHVSSEQAWLALQDPGTWAAIGGVDEVADPVFDGAGHLASFSFSATAAGKRHRGRARVMSSAAPRAMAVDIETTELAGTISVLLDQPASPGQILVQLSVRSRSLLAGLMFPVIAANIGDGLPARVDSFASRLTTH